jgi:DNA-binding protein H-NS
MREIDFNSIPLEELWALHEEIRSRLITKLEQEKHGLEQRLLELNLSYAPKKQRRPYPDVLPKFRNPERPHETWSGRGKQPRWVSKFLVAGKTLDDLRISSRRR